MCYEIMRFSKVIDRFLQECPPDSIQCLDIISLAQAVSRDVFSTRYYRFTNSSAKRIALEIFGICSGDKRSYEQAEANHLQIVEVRSLR
jgi:hypothetical protein